LPDAADRDRIGPSVTDQETGKIKISTEHPKTPPIAAGGDAA